jgi:hypothetical protein
MAIAAIARSAERCGTSIPTASALVTDAALARCRPTRAGAPPNRNDRSTRSASESHDSLAVECASARPCDEFGDPTFPVHRSFSIMVATHPAEVP